MKKNSEKTMTVNSDNSEDGIIMITIMIIINNNYSNINNN